MQQGQLRQLVLIDHVITNRPDTISSGISDHDALFFIRNTRAESSTKSHNCQKIQKI